MPRRLICNDLQEVLMEVVLDKFELVSKNLPNDIGENCVRIVVMAKIEAWNLLNTSRDSSVGIVVDYGLDGRVRFPTLQDGSLLHSVESGPGAHPVSYTVGKGGSFPGGKAAEV
jgi:hypothetical protein